MQASYQLNRTSTGVEFVLSGDWTLSQISRLESKLESEEIPSGSKITVDGSALGKLDTSGAMIVFHLLQAWNAEYELRNVSEEQFKLAQLVAEKLSVPSEITPPEQLNFFARVGRSVLEVLGKLKDLLAFIGEAFVMLARLIFQPHKIRRKELVVQLEQVFIDALFVNALVTFLIGVVVAYLFALQIEKYGANIFIVDAVALAMCRELSPIIVAIIVAGRSGSAFTAQIGSMKINEELDAMKTMGLAPMQVLVMPRVLALMIAMPFLVFLGDVVGILGGMLIAEMRLDITGVTYLDRLSRVLKLKSVWVGLIKAPVFAAFIAIIGCRMGLGVKRDARSLGLSTTSTVVQSIVSVILLNAAFAIVFAELGI